MLGLFGQSRKFSQQLDAKWKSLYRLAFSWCHDPDLANDIVQDTLTKAYRKRAQLKDIKTLDAWLYKILANTWRDQYRSQKPTISVDDITLATKFGPGEEYDRTRIVSSVRRAIDKLNQEQRLVVTLVDLEGLAYSEVAEILSIPIGTVMSRLCRARNNLKQHLKEFNSQTSKNNSTIRRIK
ncbi:RNA polymerase sigma factor [Kaarinaea lacus]